MSRISSGLGVAVATSLLICVVCGCGEKQTNYKVSGTITYQGKPVPDGEVFLRPSGGNSGSGGFGIITNGTYETVPNRGSQGGLTKITFHGFGIANPKDEMDDGGVDLFSPYEVEIDLPQEDHVYNVEVPAK